MCDLWITSARADRAPVAQGAGSGNWAPCWLDLSLRLPYRPGMYRRRFLLTSVAGALAAPLSAGAQQPWRVGVLEAFSVDRILKGASPASLPVIE